MNADSSWCTFRLGAALYGVEVGLVQSVATLPPLTPIPHAPAAVCGYVNLRGQVHLVLDLRTLLGGERAEPGPESRLVLFKPALGDPTGVVVDAVGDIVTLAPGEVEAPRSLETGLDEDLLLGIGRLERELVVLLDARRLVARVAGRE